MTLEDRLADDMKSAMREKDELRLSVIRMIRGQILLEKKKGAAGAEVTDDLVVGLVGSYVKRVREALEQAESVGRADLAERARAELAIAEGYLPAQLGDAELEAMVRDAVATTGATDVKGMGTVMKVVMERARGRAEGRRVQEAVRRALA